MFSWFFRKKPEPSPRETLLQALTDIATPDVSAKAARFYDDPATFDQYLLEHGEDPADLSDESEPEALAAEIFFQLLHAEGFIAYIDWADGFELIFDQFDKLLVKAGVKPLSDEERRSMSEIGEECRRGQAFILLDKPLERAAADRGLVVVCVDRGQDAHFPMLLSEAAYARWKTVRFGKERSVL